MQRSEMLKHLVEPTPERDTLFERLGIPLPSNMNLAVLAWAIAGLRLAAATQPEFKRSKAGRPK